MHHKFLLVEVLPFMIRLEVVDSHECLCNS